MPDFISIDNSGVKSLQTRLTAIPKKLDNIGEYESDVETMLREETPSFVDKAQQYKQSTVLKESTETLFVDPTNGKRLLPQDKFRELSSSPDFVKIEGDEIKVKLGTGIRGENIEDLKRKIADLIANKTMEKK